ncbi:hypothetical protein ACOSQ4_033112 [Xanthoceras sorbifolium]
MSTNSFIYVHIILALSTTDFHLITPTKLLFIFQVPISKVEQLALEWNWIVKEMLHGKFSEYSCNLKVLELISASKQNAICPCCFLYTLPNLERLDVYASFFEEIFICKGLDCKEKHLEAPSKLNYVRLIALEDSLHLCMPW